MFEFLTTSETDAINLIKKDHDKVKEIFDQFENADTLRDKRKLVAEALTELKLHAAVEEEIFYPAVRRQLDEKIMTEADEEHHVAKVLIAELDEMDGKEPHFDAKFKVLAENIRHHIKEEERDMLPKARKLDLNMEALGEQILERKAELLEKGIKPTAEAKMVAAAKGKGDSPAAAATRR